MAAAHSFEMQAILASVRIAIAEARIHTSHVSKITTHHSAMASLHYTDKEDLFVKVYSK
jgi:hypothetical protein